MHISLKDTGQKELFELTIGDIMNCKDEDLDLLLENIQLKIEKNRMRIEQGLEEFLERRQINDRSYS